MTTPKYNFAAVTAMAFLIATSIVAPANADDWAQFRGSGGASVSSANIPIDINDKDSLAWKIEMPGKGASSPIVVGNKVVVTCSSGANQEELYTVCIDATSGKELWRQKFFATGRTLCHPLSANAAPTPASDGKHIYAFFSSNDLACMDLDGNLLWYRGLAVDHPKAGNDVGMASSVVCADGVVIAQMECQQDSFAIGMDAKTGATVWEQPRTEVGNWASPILINIKDQPAMVVLQSADKVTVNIAKTGQEVYSLEGACSTVSSATFNDGVLYVPINGTTAISVGGVDKFETVWSQENVRPRSVSALVHGDKVYAFSGGVMNMFNAADGTPDGKFRVGGRSYWATPAIAGEHMYFFDQDGKARVVNMNENEVIHEHEFADEVFLGTPAFDKNSMFVRSDKYLYRFSNKVEE